MFVDVQNSNERIVMNGIMTPNYGLWLNLSTSISPADPPETSFKPIINGEVNYFIEDSLINTIIENSSGNYYDTSYLPQVGRSYQIVVDAPGLPQARATVTMPAPVEFEEFNAEIIVRQKGDVYNGYKNEVDFFVNFTLDDPGYIKNYYMLGAYYLKDGQYYAVKADTEDINMNIYIKDGIDILAWTDHEFNGQTGDFTVSVRLFEPVGFVTRLRFVLYSIEECYYKYLKSYSQNFTVMNEDAFLFEAVPVFSNIEGGYGVVAAATSDVRSFEYTF
jgi:hypothetical protein